MGQDGQINILRPGSAAVAGQLPRVVWSEIASRMVHRMIVKSASVTMEVTRSIQVFVMGNVFEPGSYTISRLGTMTSALNADGDTGEKESLQRIAPKRSDVVVCTRGLYDLLIRDSIKDPATEFGFSSGRDRIIQTILSELRMQIIADHPAQVVTGQGRANVPGHYPLQAGMIVADHVRTGCGWFMPAGPSRPGMFWCPAARAEPR